MDDIIAFCRNPEELDRVDKLPRATYPEVKSHDGPVLPYLGQVLDTSEPGVCRVTIPGYVQNPD